MKMFNKNKDVVMAFIIIIWLFIDILSVAISYSLELDAKTITHIVNMVVVLILWVLLIIYLLSPKWIEWCNKEF